MPRNSTLDIMRGILIFVVLVSHAMCVNGSSGLQFVNGIEASFMATFFLMSGYLAYKTIGTNSFVWLLRKLYNRGMPLLIFTGIYYLLMPYSYINGGFAYVFGYSEGLSSFVKSGFDNALWFMWSLLLCSVGVAIVHFASRRFNGIAGLTITTCVISILILGSIYWENTTDGQFGTYKFQWYLPFFFIGYLFSRYSKWEKRKWHLAVPGVVLFPVVMALSHNCQWMKLDSLSSPLILISMIAMIYCIFSVVSILALVISKIHYLNKYLEYLGINCVVIYLVNPICLSVITLGHGSVATFYGIVISTTLCIFVAHVVKRLYILKGILFGDLRSIKRTISYLTNWHVITAEKTN